MRQYIEEGGRLMFTGKYAGPQYAQGYEFDLEHGGDVRPGHGGRRVPGTVG